MQICYFSLSGLKDINKLIEKFMVYAVSTKYCSNNKCIYYKSLHKTRGSILNNRPIQRVCFWRNEKGADDVSLNKFMNDTLYHIIVYDPTNNDSYLEALKVLQELGSKIASKVVSSSIPSISLPKSKSPSTSTSIHSIPKSSSPSIPVPTILVLSLSSKDNTLDKVVSEKMGQTMLDNIYPYEYYEVILKDVNNEKETKDDNLFEKLKIQERTFIGRLSYDNDY